MYGDLPPNTMARPYRGLSVQHVAIAMEPGAIRQLLLGRESYRRTEFLLMSNETGHGLVRIAQKSRLDLFNPITAVEVLAVGQPLVWIEAPEVNVSNASALAMLAERYHRVGARAWVVHGAYSHVNFIWKPRLLGLEIWEVSSPLPYVIKDMAEQVLAFDEDLPPIRLISRSVGRPAAGQPPFGGGCHGASGDRDVPPGTCPYRACQAQLSSPAGMAVATCCEVTRGVQTNGTVARLPLNPSLDEVRAALRWIAGLPASPDTEITLASHAQAATRVGRDASAPAATSAEGIP